VAARRKCGLIRIRREPRDSARSLLQHPEHAAQPGDASLKAALQLILRYDQLADGQQRCFPGPVLSLDFKDVTDEELINKPSSCIRTIDRFIESLTVSGMISALTRNPEMTQC
jgi:hypothetical protein